MAEYIDRTALKSQIAENKLMAREPAAKRILAMIDDMPAADVAKVVHGKWGDNGIAGSILVKCSVCGFDCGANSFSYCPNCGARMDGGNEGE